MTKTNFVSCALVAILLMGCENAVVGDDDVKQKTIEAVETSATPQPPKEKLVETLLPDAEYEIQVSAVELGPTKVEVTTTTNLPLPVQVMAGVSLQGQKPEETWIGFNQKITLKTDTQTFVLDFPKKPLPTGIYDVEATFYPRWGAKNGNSIASQIGKNIEGVNQISLTGDGQRTADRMEKDKMQLWIMENVNPATAYNESTMRAKLGASEPVAVTKMNPNIIKGHYFPKADMTIYVNTLKNEYVTFRKGRDTNGM